MSAITVPAAKAVLLDALVARLAPVQVEWAHPGANRIKSEAVFFGDTEYATEAKSLGNRDRRESYVIEIVVTIHKKGNDARAAEERCWAILTDVEDVVRQNADLDGTVRVAQYEASPVRNYVGAQERVSESVLRVSVSADI